MTTVSFEFADQLPTASAYAFTEQVRSGFGVSLTNNGTTLSLGEGIYWLVFTLSRTHATGVFVSVTCADVSSATRWPPSLGQCYVGDDANNFPGSGTINIMVVVGKDGMSIEFQPDSNSTGNASGTLVVHEV